MATFRRGYAAFVPRDLWRQGCSHPERASNETKPGHKYASLAAVASPFGGKGVNSPGVVCHLGGGGIPEVAIPPPSMALLTHHSPGKGSIFHSAQAKLLLSSKLPCMEFLQA